VCSLVPGVIIGVTLLTFFSRLGLQQSYPALVLAHSLWATPLTFSVMQSTFARFDWQLHEAALDLGASRPRAFLYVVVPEVRAGLAVAALVAFIVSLQEFVMALFLSGPDTRTVPVQAWNSLRQSLDPLVSVVSTILLFAVVLLVLLAGALAGLERLATET
jgi:ABC-type spermidine/putrescine transport system permease subunit II